MPSRAVLLELLLLCSVLTGAEDPSLAHRSRLTLHKTRYASVGLLCCGLVALVTNSIVLVTIAKSKRLHTRCFLLMAHLAVADWLVGAAYVGTGIKRLVRIKYNWAEVNTARHCSAEMLLAYFGQAASLTLALALAIDRTIAICAPSYYKKLTKWAANVLALVFWAYAVIDAVGLIYNSHPQTLIPNCNLVSSVNDAFYKFQSKHKLSLVIVVNLFYVFVVYKIRQKSTEGKIEGDSTARQNSRQRETQISQMCAIIGSLYLVTQIFTRSILAALSGIEASQRARIAPFVRMLMILNSGINLFVYVSRSTLFRRAFCELLGRKNQVVPSSHKATHNKGNTKY